MPVARRSQIRISRLRAPERRIRVLLHAVHSAHESTMFMLGGAYHEGVVNLNLYTQSEADYLRMKSIFGERTFYTAEGPDVHTGEYRIRFRTSDRPVLRYFLNKLIQDFQGFENLQRTLTSSGFALQPRVETEDQLPSWLRISNLEPWVIGRYEIQSSLTTQKIKSIVIARNEVNGNMGVTVFSRPEHASEFRDSLAESPGRTHIFLNSTPMHHTEFEPINLAGTTQINELLATLRTFDPSLDETEIFSLRLAFSTIDRRIPETDHLFVDQPHIIQTPYQPTPIFLPMQGMLLMARRATQDSSPQSQTLPARSKHAITLAEHQDLIIDDEMICPISLEIMEDPVYFTGLESNNKKCFERTQILHLLSKANPRHPLTREPITLQQMQRDDELRQRIEDFVDLAVNRRQARELSSHF